MYATQELQKEFEQRKALAESQGYIFSVAVFRVNGQGVVATQFEKALRMYLHEKNGHIPPDILLQNDDAYVALIEGSIAHASENSLRIGRAGAVLDSFVTMAVEKAKELNEKLKIEVGAAQYASNKSLDSLMGEAEKNIPTIYVSPNKNSPSPIPNIGYHF